MADVEQMIVDRIQRAQRQHPRGLQRRVGPSGVGTPCDRKLGYQLSGVDKIRATSMSWPSTVGTAVHAWLEELFSDDPEWLTEHRVYAGKLDGTELDGSSDLFWIQDGVVVDFKIVGPTSLKKLSKGIPQGYEVQRHVYGLGFKNAGYKVTRVALMILPAAGQLSQRVYDEVDYDEALALRYVAKADNLAKAGRLAGWDNVMPQLAMADDFCQSCPFYNYSADDWREGCVGVNQRSQMEGLI